MLGNDCDIVRLKVESHLIKWINSAIQLIIKEYRKESFSVKEIQLNSPEFNRVLKNMQLENLHLSQSLQQKALEIVNSGMPVTPALIKEALANGEIQ